MISFLFPNKKEMDYVFFSASSSPFSNWYPSKFSVSGETYVCMEQFLMKRKADLFRDTETGKKIMASSDPKIHKKLGREVKGFDEAVWKAQREVIVYEGLYAKFSQNPELRKKLAQTGDALLVEASPWDSIWGIGMSAENALKTPKSSWGQNILGKTLTKVRNDLGSGTQTDLDPYTVIERINRLADSKDVRGLVKTIPVVTLNKTREILDDLYYNTSEPGMDDWRYDIIKDAIPGKQGKVGASLREGENRTKLPYWLGSADKITEEDPGKLDIWLRKNRSSTFFVSEKLDGVSCLLVHLDGELKLYTRGDGLVGADISYLSEYFPLPDLKVDIAVRGELIIPTEIFEKKYSDTYKNPRNMVSGLVGSKTAREGLKDMHFVAYEVVASYADVPSKQFRTLSGLGFEVALHTTLKTLDFQSLNETLSDFRNRSHYNIDGIVVQPDEKYTRNEDGNPKYMFAFKSNFAEVEVHTEVLDVVWDKSRWGKLTPVAIVKTVRLDGVDVSRVTAVHAKFVIENNIGPGAIVHIVRSGQVIPYIVRVVQGTAPKMPDEDWYWDDNKVFIYSREMDSNMCVKVVVHFFKTLGIKFVAEETVRKMFSGGLDNLFKILDASKSDLLRIPTFKEATANNIIENIRKGFVGVSIPTLIAASSVLGYGISTQRVEAIFKLVPNLLEIYDTKTEKQLVELLTRVEGIAELTAKKIIPNLKYARIFVEKIRPYIVENDQPVESKEPTLAGKKFVLTGGKGLAKDIEMRGGTVSASVSKNTTAVVTKDLDSTSEKMKKAKSLGIPIWLESDFIREFLS